MKDFYDIWLLASQTEFDAALLSRAITATFAHRHTQLVTTPAAFTTRFAERPDKATQWNAFVRRHLLMHAPETLSAAVREIAGFLLPVVSALAEGQSFRGHWPPGGPWQGSNQREI
jgi:hypothetical protein